MGELGEVSKKLEKWCGIGNTEKLYLVGEGGVGKSSMAKKMSDLAVKRNCCDFTLWIFMSCNYSRDALLESIARQMSLLDDYEDDWEAADDNKEPIREEEEYSDNPEKLITAIRTTLADKRILLVLDDEGSLMREDDIMPELEDLLPSQGKGSYRILITRAVDPVPDGNMIDMKPLSKEEFLLLLKQRTDATVPDRLVAKAASIGRWNLPSAIHVIAKALNHLGTHGSGVQFLEKELQIAADDKNYHILGLVRGGYDRLPISVLFDFCWPGRHFFRERGSVHYSELIAYWMLEGYLGRIDSVEKAYETGHDVVMELIECHLLKELEGGYIVMDPHVLNLYDISQLGYHGTVTLGLATVFDNKWKGLGRITHKDGIVRTLVKDKEGKNLSTLLVDGDHCGGEVLTNLQQLLEFQALALFHHTMKELPSTLSKLTNLRILVLRGFDFLQKLDLSLYLTNLTVLEISGATTLNKIPDDFFKNMPKLRSLNFSELNIESLPSSLYDLVDLRWLILRSCSSLREVGSLTKLVDLVHINLSGATSFQSFKDKNFHKNSRLQILDLSKTQIKSLPLFKELGSLTHLLLNDCSSLDRLRSIIPLTSLQTLDLSGAIKFEEFHDQSLEKVVNLKILDLSNTLVEFLPSNISNPTRIYLKNCSMLTRLIRMESLKDLEVFDLSGSNNVHEIEEGFFDNLRCLQQLKLSETKVTSLPSLSNLSELHELVVSHCQSLKELPDLNSLKKLEVLDASHCTALTSIPNKSFESMSCLQILNLSDTMLSCLPPLPNPNTLCKLLLKNCTYLENFPEDINLLRLEELNLSGVNLRGKTRTSFLKDMSNLQILDLSDTRIEGLPPMSNLEKLIVLSLRGCKDLTEVPNLENLTNLEVLDLSGTSARQLQSLSSFRNLRQFHSSTEDFRDLKMADVLGHSVTQLPSWTSDLNHLELLELPGKKTNQEAGISQSMKPRQDLSQPCWVITNWSTEAEAGYDKHRISVIGTQFIEHLKEDPTVWDTSFKKFHFLVCPLEQLNRRGDKSGYRNELIFRDTFFQASQFTHSTEREQSLEIRGFQTEPVDVDHLLGHAATVYLIDNPFIKYLCAEKVKKMKVCWIERCNEMESVIGSAKSGEHTEEMETLENNLETLLISNAINFMYISRGNLKNLKCLYLDCCPKVSEAFCSTQQLENLEVLEIKFCDKLERLFGHNSAMLPKLRTLHLKALPELKGVVCNMPNLESLKVGECPMLITLLSSSTPQLEVLHINCCDKLERVFEHNLSGSALLKLMELCLWELPVLESIGVELSAPKDFSVRDCPKFPKTRSSFN